MERYVVRGIGVLPIAWLSLEAMIFAVGLAPSFGWLLAFYIVVPSAVFWGLYTWHADQVQREMDASEDDRVPPKLFAIPFVALLGAFALSQVNETRWFD